MTTGYLTQQDLISMKLIDDKNNIITEQLMDLIKEDQTSELKKQMSYGSNYYNMKHDILNYIKYYYIEKIKTVDETSANNKLPHPFHKILVDQKVSYIAGNPIVINVKTTSKEQDPVNPDPVIEKEKEAAKEYQNLLTDYLSLNFNDIVVDWIKYASNKAIEYLHPYVNPNGELKLVITPAEEIIPVYDTQYQNKLVGVIRYYTYTYISEGQSVERYKVEWWTETDVTYYTQLENNKFILDLNYDINPAPHFYLYNTQNPTIKTGKSWGKVPFIPLKNNTDVTTDLEPIKALIDAYDKVKSGWINDLEDFQELILVVKGFMPMSSQIQEGMSELAIFLQNLKTHKVVSVDTESGSGVDTLKAEIPVEAKEKFLTLTRREIFYFGQGVDIDSEKFGNSPSGISLKFLYSGLDLKANTLIRKLTKALQDLMYFVVFFINLIEKKQYDYKKLTFTFNKSIIFNEKEKIDSVKASDGVISNDTLLANHPWVNDVEEEKKKIEIEKEADMEQNLFMLENQAAIVDDKNKDENK